MADYIAIHSIFPIEFTSSLLRIKLPISFEDCEIFRLKTGRRLVEELSNFREVFELTLLHNQFNIRMLKGGGEERIQKIKNILKREGGI
ncbi:MAG: hypothetical protein ACKKMO_01430 [Candidatus Nealsonbacteria bacterium]